MFNPTQKTSDTFEKQMVNGKKKTRRCPPALIIMLVAIALIAVGRFIIDESFEYREVLLTLFICVAGVFSTRHAKPCRIKNLFRKAKSQSTTDEKTPWQQG